MSDAVTPAPRRKRTRRRRWWLLVPLVLLVGFFCWLAFSSSGLGFVVSSASRWLPETVTIKDVGGRLVGPLRIAEVSYSEAGTTVLISGIELDWRPWELFWNDAVMIESLSVAGLSIARESESSTDGAAVVLEPISQPPALSSPIDIFVQRLAIAEIRYSDVSSSIDLGNLALSGSWQGDELEIESLTLAGGPIDLTGSAHIDSANEFSLAMDLQHSLRLPQVAALEGVMSLRGEWDDLRLTLQTKAPYKVGLNLSLAKLSSEPNLSGDVWVENAELQKIAQEMPASNVSLLAQVNGGLAGLNVHARVDYAGDSETGTGIPALSGQTSLTVTTTQAAIESLVLSIEGQSDPVEASGILDWAEDLRGELGVSWQSLAFDVADDQRATSRGRLSVQGGLDDYRLALDGDVVVADVRAPLRAQAFGGRDFLAIDTLSIGVADAVISGDGRLEWGDEAQAARRSVRLFARDVNPSMFAPHLDGLLDADVEISLAGSSDQLHVLVPGLSVRGRLNGQAVKLDVSGEFESGSLSIRGLQASIGPNTLMAEGVLGERSDITFDLNAPDFSLLAALGDVSASGSINTSGRITGALNSPRLLAELTASELRWSDYRVAQISLTADAGLQAADAFELHLESAGLRLGEGELASLQIRTTGTAADHALSVNLIASQPDAKAVIHADAGWRDNQWRFSSDSAELSASAGGVTRQLVLSAPFSGVVAAGRVVVEGLCLAVDSKAKVCGDALLSDERRSAGLVIEGFDLALLEPWLPPDIRFTGILSGSAEWPGDVRGLTADFSWRSPAFALRDGGKWFDPVQFDDSSLRVGPDGEALLVAIAFPGDRQRLLATARLTPLEQAATSDWPLSADVELELPRLGFLASVSPLVQSLKGRASGAVNVSGSLANPIFAANVDVVLPSVTLVEPTLTLKDTSLVLTTVADVIAVEARSHSGGGQLNVRGELRPSDDWAFNGRISGEKFRVSDSAQVRIDVSPDVELKLNGGLLELSGRVDVPYADIALAQLPEGAVTVSPDQVIVSEAETDTTEAVSISADLVLALGDSVTFSGLGLDATFGGELQIRERPGRATSATGEVLVRQGAYQAYGQDLTIERGRLLFAGGAIDAPGLDVRAARQATPDVRVGVDVRGSLQSPQLTVFSDPAMPSSDQIAYLVLGRPLSDSSSEEQSALRQAALALGVRGGRLVTDRLGERLAVDTIGIESAPGTGNDQAALVIGKYLTPKLYVSYGYGLFEPISTLRLEYQLNRLWRIVTESSNEATGGDIEWVMEK